MTSEYDAPKKPDIAIAAADHEAAKHVFEDLLGRIEKFEHALAADVRADVAKLKVLLHL